MLLLSLTWFGIGLLVTLMAYAARLAHPQSASRKHNLIALLITGIVISSASGWLGILLFGRLFSTAMALWLTIAGVIVLPWLIMQIQIKLLHKQERQHRTETPLTQE